MSNLHGEVFEKGTTGVGVTLGSSYSYGNNYIVLGLSGDYFVVDNLSVGAGYRAWFGSNPVSNQLSLSTNYYIPMSQKIRPYLGLFGRETFVSDRDDYSSYGGRAGVAFLNSKNSYMSFGYIYEEHSSCDRVKECSNAYPEIVFSLAF